MVEHNVSGLPGEERNVKELTELLKAITYQPENWGKWPRAARDKVGQAFERENETDKLIETFEEITGGDIGKRGQVCLDEKSKRRESV